MFALLFSAQNKTCFRDTKAPEHPGLVHSSVGKKLEDETYCICFPLQESELYFTDPKELLTIFAEMEEEILSFIQNSQEVKKSLDKVITTHESM